MLVVGAGCAVVVFVAALMTDLKLLNTLNPLAVLAPGVLDRLAPSTLLPSKFSIAPPITAAAPINDDPINPAAAVGLSVFGERVLGES